MTTPTTRTFLTLGPAGMALECSNEDALEPEHLASSPAPPSPTMPPATFAGIPFPPCERIVVGVNMAKPGTESTGAWIIHHPSRGGPSSGLREVMMALATHGRRAVPVLGLSWDVPSIGSIGCGFLAGNLRPRRKRPGQWGWRARMLRARRLDRAAQRCERERARRAQGRKPG